MLQFIADLQCILVEASCNSLLLWCDVQLHYYLLGVLHDWHQKSKSGRMVVSTVDDAEGIFYWFMIEFIRDFIWLAFKKYVFMLLRYICSSVLQPVEGKANVRFPRCCRNETVIAPSTKLAFCLQQQQHKQQTLTTHSQVLNNNILKNGESFQPS